MFRLDFTLLSALLLPLPAVAQAQAIESGLPIRTFTEAEIEAVEMPDLAYEPDPKIEADFNKYFFFHREDTSFDQAFADISECDALAQGVDVFMNIGNPTVPETFADFGPVGGALSILSGRLMGDAIFGSSERRRVRRLDLRNCMFYKGYDRYGLEKSLWQAFHFEEGFRRENVRNRLVALMKQARVASGPKPPLEVLAP